MKLRLFFKMLAVGLVIVFTSLSAFAFDDKPGRLFEWDNRDVAPDGQKYVDLENTIVQIAVLGTATGRIPIWNKETLKFEIKIAIGTFGQLGEGFVVKGIGGQLYIITAAHVITPTKVLITENNSSATRTRAIKLINRIIFAGGDDGMGYECEVVFEDQEADWAILKTKGYVPAPVPFSPPLTFTYEEVPISKGDAVGIVTNKRNDDLSKSWVYEIRYGQIVDTQPACPDASILPWFSMEDVTMNTIVYPGDSGAPVIMWRNGEPFIVGIVRAIYYDGTTFLSYFVRIDSITFLLNMPGVF